MCIFNFLIGNLDPHDENIFVQLDPNNNKLVKARMIDFGNAFPIDRPALLTPLGHEGEWGSYTISKHLFTDETVAFIKTNLTMENLGQFFSEVSVKCPNFIQKNMKKLMKERFAILRNRVSNVHYYKKEHLVLNPKRLSEIHYDEDYDKLLHKKKNNDLW